MHGGKHAVGGQSAFPRRDGALLARPTDPCHVFGVESFVDAAVVVYGSASRVFNVYPLE